METHKMKQIIVQLNMGNPIMQVQSWIESDTFSS